MNECRVCFWGREQTDVFSSSSTPAPRGVAGARDEAPAGVKPPAGGPVVQRSTYTTGPRVLELLLSVVPHLFTFHQAELTLTCDSYVLLASDWSEREGRVSHQHKNLCDPVLEHV